MYIDDRQLLLRTGEIVACLTKSRNTKELVEEVHSIIREVTYAENFCVVLLGEDGYLRFPFVLDSNSEFSPEKFENLTIEEIQQTLIFYALTSNITCNYSKEMITQLRDESLLKIDSTIPEQWLSIPLVVDDQSLGAIVLQTFDPNIIYQENDIELLVVISHVLSNALSVFSFQEQLFYANKSLKAYQSKLESLIDARTASLEKKTNVLELEVTQRKLLQKELEQKVLELESEISINRELRLQLEHQATHDFLTGLANRQQLNSHLGRCASKMARKPFSIYLLFIDLDGFKQVNDTFGHEAGDKILTSVSDRLTDLMRGHDLISRIGGDEFVAVLEQVESKKIVDDIGKRIIEELAQSYLIGEHEIIIGASIGVAEATTSDEVKDVILQADQAMYLAKAKGKGRVHWYKNELKR